MFLPGGMLGRDVQCIEIEPVGFDLRAFGDREAHIGEDGGDLFGDLADRVNRALPARTGGKGHVQPLIAQPLFQRRVGECGLARGQGAVDLSLQGVEPGPGDLPLLGAHLAQFAHLQADFALLADGLHAQILQRGLVFGIGDLRQIFFLKIVHDGPLMLGHVLLAAQPGECKPGRPA